MLEKIKGLPDNVLAVTATGKVTAEDYENLIIPEVEALFARFDKARFLYHLGDAFEGFEFAAMWDDAIVGLKHLNGWERIAVVTDVDWIRLGIRVFALAIPGEIRVYQNQELDSALSWVSEKTVA